MEQNLNPGYIMETATGFWASKTLLTAVELDLFTILGQESMTATQLGDRLGLHPRGTYDFFDALVALKFLDRDGNGVKGRYKNTPQTNTFLNKSSPAYIGGIIEMLNSRLYGFWNNLGTALKTGKPQNEIKHTGKSMFDELYSDQELLSQFLKAMSGAQAGNFIQLAEKFDFSNYHTVCDIGGALALSSCIIGQHYSQLKFTSFDLPPVAPLAQQHVDDAGMSERIKVVCGDFFVDDFPKADVIMMGNILHDWDLETKKMLIKKAYDALPENGAFIVIENIIDDERRENVFGLLMSLNMLIELGSGFDYTGADFKQWCNEIGFKNYEFIQLAGPSSAAIAFK